MICPTIGKECVKDECVCFYYNIDYVDDNEYVESECCCNPIYKYHPEWEENYNCRVFDWEIKKSGGGYGVNTREGEADRVF